MRNEFRKTREDRRVLLFFSRRHKKRNPKPSGDTPYTLARVGARMPGGNTIIISFFYLFFLFSVLNVIYFYHFFSGGYTVSAPVGFEYVTCYIVINVVTFHTNASCTRGRGDPVIFPPGSVTRFNWKRMWRVLIKKCCGKNKNNPCFFLRNNILSTETVRTVRVKIPSECRKCASKPRDFDRTDRCV